jgi:uncharacterized membrane protein
MDKNRLEASSGGIIAIITVLELKVPHGTKFSVLGPLP